MGKQLHPVILDDFYALRLRPEGSGSVRGEVVMIAAAGSGSADKRLFEVPVMIDEQSAKEWALRALQAYREG